MQYKCGIFLSFKVLNINAQKILQVIPIPVDSGRADLTAGWHSVTAHDFLDFLTRTAQEPGTQNQEDVDLPSSHGLRCQGSHLPLLLSVQTLKVRKHENLSKPRPPFSSFNVELRE